MCQTLVLVSCQHHSGLKKSFVLCKQTHTHTFSLSPLLAFVVVCWTHWDIVARTVCSNVPRRVHSSVFYTVQWTNDKPTAICPLSLVYVSLSLSLCVEFVKSQATTCRHGLNNAGRWWTGSQNSGKYRDRCAGFLWIIDQRSDRIPFVLRPLRINKHQFTCV